MLNPRRGRKGPVSNALWRGKVGGGGAGVGVNNIIFVLPVMVVCADDREVRGARRKELRVKPGENDGLQRVLWGSLTSVEHRTISPKHPVYRQHCSYMIRRDEHYSWDCYGSRRNLDMNSCALWLPHSNMKQSPDSTLGYQTSCEFPRSRRIADGGVPVCLVCGAGRRHHVCLVRNTGAPTSAWATRLCTRNPIQQASIRESRRCNWNHVDVATNPYGRTR